MGTNIIELKDESGSIYGWRNPIQVYSRGISNGKKTSRHWFMDFKTIPDAVRAIKKNHRDKITYKGRVVTYQQVELEWGEG